MVHTTGAADSRVIPSLAEEHIGGPYDAIVATAWQVVPISPVCGRKLYYLQDYESYLLGTPAERDAIARTVAVPWPLVVSSPAVAQFVPSSTDRLRSSSVRWTSRRSGSLCPSTAKVVA